GIALSSAHAPWAFGERSQTPAEASNSTACKVLDERWRYPKQHRLSLQAYGGSYLGASTGGTFITGARLFFFLTRSLGLGANYGYSQLAPSHDLGPVSSKAIHIVNGQLELSIDSSMRFGDTVIEADLFGTFGGGALRI